ncbi:porin family protein [Chryseolinea sp. H1M3-3]|uniref:porin family protein n=1 Tax=Chryseolinea sp. H1M3-3 TaxID=3034144 RepID=UPI0023EBA7EB|nr:porin family protein [Chryseolinea sp. H1M3-3]
MKPNRLLKEKLGMLALVSAFMAFTINAQAQNETSTETTVRTQTETTTIDTDTDDRDDDQPRARAGFKGGLNASNLITDEVTDNNARYGFHVGVYGQLFANEGFAIQPELNYSTKGNKVTTTFGVIDQETKFNLNYLDVPILAVFKLGNAAEIHAGAYWAYLVGANIDTDGDLGDGFVQLDRDNFDDWDYGLVGGIGFNLGDIQLGARYNYGLNTIARSSGAKAMLGDTKNSVGQIYLAVNLAGHRSK